MNERITTAGIVIKDRRVLVGKRSTGKSTSGLWEFPGGKNRYGETPEETLTREFEEELGTAVSVGQLIAEHDFVNDDTLYHLMAYEVSPASWDFSCTVHSEFALVDKKGLLSLDMVPSDAAIRGIIAAEYL